jgi:hypothetical protein
MAGCAMFGFCAQLLAVGCLDFKPNGWRCNAWILSLMAGGAMLIITSARWWRNADFERRMDASILSLMAGAAMLGKGLKAKSG